MKNIILLLNTRIEFAARSILDLGVNNICLSVNFVVNARVLIVFTKLKTYVQHFV